MPSFYKYKTDAEVISLPMVLGNIADGDMVTSYPMRKKGFIKKVRFVTDVVASTAGKASTLNLEIGSTNVTGGVVALTTVSCNTIGKITEGTAITGTNGFNAGDTISVEASSTTKFSQGSGSLQIEVEYV